MEYTLKRVKAFTDAQLDAAISDIECELEPIQAEQEGLEMDLETLRLEESRRHPVVINQEFAREFAEASLSLAIREFLETCSADQLKAVVAKEIETTHVPAIAA
jgi:hypothetical protein